MKKDKMIALLKEELEAERIEAEENNREEKKVIMYFKYEKDNEVFVGNSCCLFCLDRNLIPVKRSKCFLLPDSITKHIVEEVEGSDLVQIIKKAEIKENHDDYKTLSVFELENDPDGSLGFHFYLNKSIVIYFLIKQFIKQFLVKIFIIDHLFMCLKMINLLV